MEDVHMKNMNYLNKVLLVSLISLPLTSSEICCMQQLLEPKATAAEHQAAVSRLQCVGAQVQEQADKIKALEEKASEAVVAQDAGEKASVVANASPSAAEAVQRVAGKDTLLSYVTDNRVVDFVKANLVKANLGRSALYAAGTIAAGVGLYCGAKWLYRRLRPAQPAPTAPIVPQPAPQKRDPQASQPTPIAQTAEGNQGLAAPTGGPAQEGGNQLAPSSAHNATSQSEQSRFRKVVNYPFGWAYRHPYVTATVLPPALLGLACIYPSVREFVRNHANRLTVGGAVALGVAPVSVNYGIKGVEAAKASLTARTERLAAQEVADKEQVIKLAQNFMTNVFNAASFEKQKEAGAARIQPCPVAKMLPILKKYRRTEWAHNVMEAIESKIEMKNSKTYTLPEAYHAYMIYVGGVASAAAATGNINREAREDIGACQGMFNDRIAYITNVVQASIKQPEVPREQAPAGLSSHEQRLDEAAQLQDTAPQAPVISAEEQHQADGQGTEVPASGPAAATVPVPEGAQ